MKTRIKYLLYILASTSIISCASERRNSLGSDSVGVIGYVKPVKHVKGKAVYVSTQKAQYKAEM
jgi:hypothetical protein